MKHLELDSHKLKGFGNRRYTLRKDYLFNGYILKKGLNSDGGSIPKYALVFIFLVLNEIYDLHIVVSLIAYAIMIDESCGWFQKPFFAHDQRWRDATSWSDFLPANYNFFKDIKFKIKDIKYHDVSIFKKIHHFFFAVILMVVYPLAVTINPVSWWIFYKKLKG